MKIPGSITQIAGSSPASGSKTKRHPLWVSFCFAICHGREPIRGPLNARGVPSTHNFMWKCEKVEYKKATSSSRRNGFLVYRRSRPIAKRPIANSPIALQGDGTPLVKRGDIALWRMFYHVVTILRDDDGVGSHRLLPFASRL